MQRRVLNLAVVILGCLAVPAGLKADDAADYLKRAKTWVDKHEYEKAIEDCNQALALDPKSAEAFNTRGHARTKLGEYDKAIDDGDQALALDPKFAKAYITRGIAWECKYDHDKAIADYNHALALDPKSAAAYAYRGETWGHKGVYNKALADCNQALVLDPKFADAYFARSWVWDYRGEPDKALADMKQAVALDPGNWNPLNNLGVLLWKKAQQQDFQAAKAETAGDLDAAKAFRQKSVALKNDAKAQWNRGITVNPKATDIHSNLGYAYSEANDLDSAERHLKEAVRLKPIAPRPRNNLGRVLLRKSMECEGKARDAEFKGKTDSAKAAKAMQFHDEAKTKLNLAIEQFEEAVRLDPTLLEARLNLGEVFISLNGRDKAENNLDKAEKDLDKAEDQYREILKLWSENIKDRETINYFSVASSGLARIALTRKNSDKAIEFLQQALERNPQNVAAMQMLARERFERGEFGEGEKCLWHLLAVLPAANRRFMAEQFGKQFEAAGKTKEAIRAWNFLAWAFATSPDPQILDPQAAMHFAQHVAGMTKQQDAVSLDTLAAAQAAGGQYKQAVQTAQDAIKLANSQGKKPLADAISARLPTYQQGKPYRCDRDGSDRP